MLYTHIREYIKKANTVIHVQCLCSHSNVHVIAYTVPYLTWRAMGSTVPLALLFYHENLLTPVHTVCRQILVDCLDECHGASSNYTKKNITPKHVSNTLQLG